MGDNFLADVHDGGYCLVGSKCRLVWWCKDRVEELFTRGNVRNIVLFYCHEKGPTNHQKNLQLIQCSCHYNMSTPWQEFFMLSGHVAETEVPATCARSCAECEALSVTLSISIINHAGGAGKEWSGELRTWVFHRLPVLWTMGRRCKLHQEASINHDPSRAYVIVFVCFSKHVLRFVSFSGPLPASSYCLCKSWS